MNKDLQELEELIRTLNWFINSAHEPTIGAPESPRLADNYGTRGQSLFVVFLEKKDGGVHECAFERCSATFTRNLEGAIRHIRDHHFRYYPFACGQWYVSHYSLPYSFLCARRKIDLAPTHSNRRFPAELDLTNHQSSSH